MKIPWRVLVLCGLGLTNIQAATREELFRVPDFNELPPSVEVVSETVTNGVALTELYFDGAPFNGQPTRIYGFYCRPSQPGRYPGVVQLHGAGLQTLGPAAAIFYATNGFACLSIDWCGPASNRKEPRKPPYSEFNSPGNLARPLPEGEKDKAPPHGWKAYGAEVDGVTCGVRFVRRSFMFLRSRPEVDAGKLCLSGMSAGAHLSLLVIGLEPELRAAAVKYGCGFIRDLPGYFGGYFGPMVLTCRQEQEDWLAVLDPKHGLPNTRASVLLLSGTDDIFFWMPVVLHTYREIPSPKRLLMLPNDNHSQVGNEVVPLHYYRSVLGLAPAFPEVTAPTVKVQGEALELAARVSGPKKIVKVGFWVKRMPKNLFRHGSGEKGKPETQAKWNEVLATLAGDEWHARIPVPVTNEQVVAYALVEDETGAKVTSDTVEAPDFPQWRGRSPFVPWELTLKAVDFSRAELANSQNLMKVKAAGNLACKLQPNDWLGLAGWFDYDFFVPAEGWYELLAQPTGLGAGHAFILDGKDATVVTWGGDKVGSTWLAAGKHTLRVQRFIWTGFSALTGFTLRAVGAVPSQKIRIKPAGDRLVFRKGEALELDIVSTCKAEVTACVTETGVKPVIARYALRLAAALTPVSSRSAIPCAQEGEFTVSFEVDGKPAARDLPPIRFTVIDATPVLRTGGELKRTLVREIDCVATEPVYQCGGTRVVDRPFGRYRESGAIGWLQNQTATDPSWFAYTTTVAAAQQPYVLEVDYPDDALRTFCVAIRERAVASYPVVSGVDSGGEFSLSRGMLTHSVVFWPQGTDLRIVLITPQTGRRAAAARLRLYRVEGEFPLPTVSAAGARSFANWYEEGLNFLGFYGVADRSLKGVALGADRWARSIAWMGGDTLVPTVSVYQMSLFPSRFNVSFADPSSADAVRVMLFKCEKYGLKFIGEFHPEARELAWSRPADGSTNCPFMISRDGKTSSGGPKFNPLYPANSDWYLGMIGEFADRYKDSPAFRGVSLRLMTWANPGLNNFHSLDWGYDDYTVGLFEKETGTKIPLKGGGEGRFRERYDWLMANAKEAWVTWRCAKIAEVYQRIRDRVRQARPDLRVYSDVFGGFPADLREAGLDTKRLSALNGVSLVNALHSYGRRQHSQLETQAARDALLEPASLNAVSDTNGLGGYLFGAGYFEATEAVVPPEALGLPADTKRTWMSGVVNPAGRHALERWAIALAEGDAAYLSDGGNAYTLGQPILREFLQEYRSLPCASFTPRKDARDPVAVWTRDVQGIGTTPEPRTLKPEPSFLFYAVNRAGYPVRVDLQFAQPGLLKRLSGETLCVRRLSTGAAVPTPGGRLRLDLRPYELLAFSAASVTQILTVESCCPDAEVARVYRQVVWLEKLAQEDAAQSLKAKLKQGDSEALSALAREARVSLDAGHLWQASGIVQNHRLLSVYRAAGKYPPDSHVRLDLAEQKLPHALLRFSSKQCPQTDLGTPEGLVARLVPAEGVAKLEPCKAVGSEAPLVTWFGATALLRLPFAVTVPQRFQVWARLAVYPQAPRLTVAGADGVEIPLAVEETETGLQTVHSAQPIVLQPGTTAITFRVQGAASVHLEQVFLEPAPSRIEPLQFVGYFPNPGNSNWTAALPPERAGGHAPGAAFDGTDGKNLGKVTWKPMPKELINAQPHVARCPPAPLGPEVIAYCRTSIEVPSDRDACLHYLGAAHLRVFLNGELLADSLRDKIQVAWWAGYQVLPVKLRKGANELLVKMANNTDKEGYKLIYFEGRITDPGDLSLEAAPE